MSLPVTRRGGERKARDLIDHGSTTIQPPMRGAPSRTVCSSVTRSGDRGRLAHQARSCGLEVVMGPPSPLAPNWEVCRRWRKIGRLSVFDHGGFVLPPFFFYHIIRHIRKVVQGSMMLHSVADETEAVCCNHRISKTAGKSIQVPIVKCLASSPICPLCSAGSVR